MNARLLLRRGLRTFVPLIAVATLLSACSASGQISVGPGSHKAGSGSQAADIVEPAPRFTEPGKGNRIDLMAGCASQQGKGSKPVIMDSKSEQGIVCVGANHQGESVSVDAWCAQALEGSKADDSDPRVAPHGWKCITAHRSVSVDLQDLCPPGWNLVDFETSSKESYDYRCVNPDKYIAFDYVRYCEGTYRGMTIYAFPTRRNDPLSWTCASSP